MNRFEKENPGEKSGDSLRDYTAELLERHYDSPATIEYRNESIKADVYIQSRNLGSLVETYAECKDHASKLSKKQVKEILIDYEHALEGQKSQLIIVTRHGLSTDAAKIVELRNNVFHNTISQLEDEVLGISPYVSGLAEVFKEGELDKYFIFPSVKEAIYDQADDLVGYKEASTFDEQFLDAWIADDNSPPLAILGGYGTGKTSLAKFVASTFAKRAETNENKRSPVFVKLGALSTLGSFREALSKIFEDSGCRNFNHKNLKHFNDAGRLILILDGFDEMKHAMGWHDFLNICRSINEYIGPKSKVILLGRPSAFLSDIEYAHVLRGVRKQANSLQRHIPDWPKYKVFELQFFEEESRRSFIENYLDARISIDLADNSGWNENKINERKKACISIIELNKELFSRPVHLKILADIAVQPTSTLFSKDMKVSRWTLYDNFMGLIAEREQEKDARRGFTTQERYRFLSSLAFFLWNDKKGRASFRPSELPSKLFKEIGVDTEDEEELSKCSRELLVGSILERKAGDIFFFGHRSFAEYLVAKSYLLEVDNIERHRKFNAIVDAGVLEFIGEGMSSEESGLITADALVKSLASISRGEIRSEYANGILSFLDTSRHTLASTIANVNQPMAASIYTLRDIGDEEKVFAHIIDLIKNAKTDLATSALHTWITSIDGLAVNIAEKLEKVASVTLGLLLRSTRDNSYTLPDPFHKVHKELGSAIFQRVEMNQLGERVVTVNLSRFEKHIRQSAVSFGTITGSYFLAPNDSHEISLELASIVARMPNQNHRRRAEDYFKKRNTLAGFTTVELKKRPRIQKNQT